MLELLMVGLLFGAPGLSDILEPPILAAHDCAVPKHSGDGWTIECHVSNSAPVAVARISGTTLWKDTERTVPWARSEFDMLVPGGIEPGETRELALPHPDPETAPKSADPRSLVSGLVGWAIDDRPLAKVVRERAEAKLRHEAIQRQAEMRRTLDAEGGQKDAGQMNDKRSASGADAPARALDKSSGRGPNPGPPLTGAEQDAFRVAVQQCWNVDAGSEAARVTLTVAFDLDPQGRVQGDVRRISGAGGSDGAIEAAFQAARRAILRCQRDGYVLPVDKYEQWHQTEMTFDPSGIRMR